MEGFSPAAELVGATITGVVVVAGGAGAAEDGGATSDCGVTGVVVGIVLPRFPLTVVVVTALTVSAFTGT